MMKRIFAVLYLSACSFITWAMPMTQAEFDRQLDEQTDIVNASKKVLDQQNTDADAEAQKIAFCQRVKAYHQIYQLAESHPELENAAMMKLVAGQYLERQKQSMQNSGMTENFICGSAQPSKATL